MQDSLTINTHFRLFKLTPLPFGVKSTTGIFQRAIESKLRGLKHTVVRVDDMSVEGRDDTEVLKNLQLMILF